MNDHDTDKREVTPMGEYPKVHKRPEPLIPNTFQRLDSLWERYPQYHERKLFTSLEELLEDHESYQEDFEDADLVREYKENHMEKFLVRLSWSDLAYRQATRRLIEAAGSLQKNYYVDKFMKQFEGWDTDHKAYFLFPESVVSQFFVIMEVVKRAEEFHPIENIFPDENKVHFLAVFDKRNMDDVLLMYHLVYGSRSADMPGAYSLYDYPLSWYLTHLEEQGIVLRSPYLPDRLSKYQGGLLQHFNPAKTVYVRRNVQHILECGYFSSELDFFRNLNRVIMPVFQWWYQDLAKYEEKDKIKTNWRLERTKIRTRLTACGVIRPKWKHELSLFSTVRSLFPDTLYQYRPSWLGHQSLDLYIPSLNTAIEYQGLQHYQSVEFFGGEEALIHRQELDQQKAKLCSQNDVRLIEWPYSIEPTEDNVKKMMEEGKQHDENYPI